jgi:pimeloyl-ACP methyl ester carboxylesterase
MLTLLWHAETLSGRMFAVMVLCGFLLPVALLLFFRLRSRPRLCYGAIAATGALPLLILIGLTATAPNGQAPANSKVRSVFIGDGSYGRFSVFNLVPEIDQIKLGVLLSPYLDSLMTRKTADRVVNAMMPLYRDLEAQPEYHALGSVMNYSYADLYGGRFNVGHVYQFVPEHNSKEKLPVLLFLHGAAGSKKIYLWVLQKFAEQHRCIVVCPGFGFGRWRSGAVEAIERARSYAVQSLPGDPKRVYLIGLSNGGLGVSRAAAAHPDHYAGLILLCSVLDRAHIHSAEFTAGWRGRSILCIGGADDNRVPKEYLESEMDTLREAGVDVTTHFYEGEDHFFIFTARERMYEDIGNWLSKLPGTGSTDPGR